jgi:eukaryotic-like serine/threonine-protein kinase
MLSAVPVPDLSTHLPASLTGHDPLRLFALALSEEPAADASSDVDQPWTTFGGIDLYEELGRGGMGVVYRARQRVLDRVVAVKVLLRAQFASREERERFFREAQAAARLQHPGIVAVHEVGEDEGVPWFSMDYIPGRSLEQIVREHPMTAQSAAECVQKVANALQHAHEHGVLHRDVKPSNILMDVEGDPRITDFGIARIISTETTTNRRAELTRTGQSLGSPGYAAPEQALHGKADARTDVYGLGALLYHLLTGRPPFQGPTLDAILVQLRESDPLSPRKLNPAVPRDLETICLKCLRKLPDARYSTAAAVADDLARFLAGKPILARPLSLFGKSWRVARRYPALASMIVLTVLLIVGMIGGSLAFARHQQQLEKRTALVSEARSLRQSHLAGSRTDALQKLHTAWAIAPSADIRNEIIACLALPEMSAPQRVEKMVAPDPTRSADGSRVAIFEGTDLIVRDVANGKETARLSGQTPGSLVKLDDHGTRVAIAAPQSRDLRLINVADGKLLATCKHLDTISSVDWSGQMIATGCENRFIYIWDTQGKMHHRLSGHEGIPIRVSFRPRSQELMSTSRDVHVRLWHAARGVEIARLDMPHQPHTSLWWSDDGARFIAATEKGGAEIYSVFSSSVMQLLAPPDDEPHTENFGSAALDATGLVAAVADEASLRVWDFHQGRLAAEFTGNPSQWRSALFSSGSKPQLWTCGWDELLTSRLLMRDPRGLLTLGQRVEHRPERGQILRCCSPDGRVIVLSNNSLGQFIVFWPETQKILQLAHPGNLAALLSHDQTWLLTTSYQSHGAKIWSLPDGKLLREICPEDTIIQAALSPDGKRLLLNTGKRGRLIHTTDWTEQPIPLGDLQLESMAFSTDGRYLATLGDDHIRLRDPHTFTDRVRLTLPAHVGWLGHGHLVFNADSSTLILHTALGSVVRWDLKALAQELSAAGITTDLTAVH